MSKILNAPFFTRPTAQVAKDLLGKYLVRRIGKKIISGKITEVEAYDGFKDEASHAHRGLTKRNFPMFGPVGRWYVYFTYGMHWMLNIVTGRKGYPAAVLIRGIALENMSLRSASRRRSNLTLNLNGPAKLTKFFKIDKKFNNLSANRKTGLWIEDRSVIHNSKLIIRATPRIGVAYAGSFWSKRRWRFFLA